MTEAADASRGWVSPLRVGRSYFTRRRSVTGPAEGITASLDALARPGVDTSRARPAVRAFFEQTASLELRVVSSWMWLFVPGAYFVRWLAWYVGQLRMPMREARILTRAYCLDPAKDGREGARGCIRTYGEEGPVMQVVSYAVTPGETPTLDAVFPGPIGKLVGRLRLDAVGEDDTGLWAVALVSTGVSLSLLGVSIPLPFRERFALYAADAPSIPEDLAPRELPGATLLGEHRQWVFGIPFVRYHYWFRPVIPPAARSSGPVSRRSGPVR